MEHVIAGKAVAFGEALSDEFKAYQKQIILNSAAMADEIQKLGIKLVSGGTDNHLMLLDFSSLGVTGLEVEKIWTRRVSPSTKTPCRTKPAARKSPAA